VEAEHEPVRPCVCHLFDDDRVIEEIRPRSAVLRRGIGTEVAFGTALSPALAVADALPIPTFDIGFDLTGDVALELLAKDLVLLAKYVSVHFRSTVFA